MHRSFQVSSSTYSSRLTTDSIFRPLSSAERRFRLLRPPSSLNGFFDGLPFTLFPLFLCKWCHVCAAVPGATLHRRRTEYCPILRKARVSVLYSLIPLVSQMMETCPCLWSGSLAVLRSGTRRTQREPQLLGDVSASFRVAAKEAPNVEQHPDKLSPFHATCLTARVGYLLTVRSVHTFPA